MGRATVTRWPPRYDLSSRWAGNPQKGLARTLAPDSDSDSDSESDSDSDSSMTQTQTRTILLLQINQGRAVLLGYFFACVYIVFSRRHSAFSLLCCVRSLSAKCHLARPTFTFNSDRINYVCLPAWALACANARTRSASEDERLSFGLAASCGALYIYMYIYIYIYMLCTYVYLYLYAYVCICQRMCVSVYDGDDEDSVWT